MNAIQLKIGHHGIEEPDFYLTTQPNDTALLVATLKGVDISLQQEFSVVDVDLTE